MPSKRIRSTFTDVSGGGGPVEVVEAFSDAFSLEIVAADSSAAPVDDSTFEIALELADSVAAQSESLGLAFQYNDSVATPTESNSFTIRVWLSNSAGAGVASPTLANGQNNAGYAVVETAVAGSTTETLTSDCGVNIPSGTAISSAIYRGWFGSDNTLATSNGSIIATSSSALFTDVVMFSNSGLNNNVSHPNGTFTFNLIAAGIDTLAKLQSVRILHRTSDAVAGVTPHTLSVDAGAIEIAGAFV